ncbi:FixH family protein [Sandarakinorhabdus sp. DWP1-3-1]|uniref:FixH family protein n=1 Tax=Sandarakinorhabdus sp. DWP1-3-1 TaxID=2804627 RepID=UPI003CF49FF5
MSRGFTGRHMLAVMVGFFGLVVGVNITMATFASRTFGGTVVDNSYVASQQFNGWLHAARAQAGYGWQARLGVDRARHVTVALAGAGSATATGTAHHPLGGAPDVALVFAPGSDGGLRSAAPLPPGRWLVRVAVAHGGRTARLAETLQ